MLVQAQSRGYGNATLYLGENNVRRYFSDGIRDIELQLGELCIDCELPAEFWHGQPEINDHRLCEWLQCQVFHRQQNREPLSLNLIPLGRNSYRLQAAKIQPVSATHRAIQGPAGVQRKPDTPQRTLPQTALIQPGARRAQMY